MRITTPRPHKLLALPLAGLAALLLGACGSSAASHTGAAAPAASSSAPTSSNGTTLPTSSGGATHATSTGSTGATSPATGATSGSKGSEYKNCPASDLRVSLGEETGAAGTAGVPVVFHNEGLATCVLAGFPGVDGLVANGPASSPISTVPATRASGGFEIARVLLNPGDSASALITASNIPTGSATSCPAFTNFLVTPPNTTKTTRLPGALRLCDGLEVHPVVSGTSGS